MSDTDSNSEPLLEVEDPPSTKDARQHFDVGAREHKTPGAVNIAVLISFVIIFGWILMLLLSGRH